MLIKTKITTEPLRSRMLLRETLIQRLCAAEAYPFLVISGPAGSGKTSLVGQWIEQARLQVAWYSLDEEDNEPDLFFRYLLTSLAQTDDRLHKAFCPILENHWELAAENVIPHIIESLSVLPLDIHLVLDDFQRITNAEIHNALARLIEHIPTRLHIIILSRYCLPAPIDAVTLKKERIEISAADLRFKEKEAAALYKEVIPLSISPEQIHDLNRHMEGWAAGLQLVGLSIKSQGHHQNLSNILNQANEQVANYLIHDILRLQPEKIRNFVFTTALLDRFNPELCAEVTGMPDVLKTIAHLEHINLFLIPLTTDSNSQRRWYRYHHMFSGVIRRQAAINDPNSIPATLRKAALWYARHHHLEDALSTAFRSCDIEFTADLMEDFIMGYVETFDVAAGLRWILKLPEKVLNQRVLLRLQQCGFLSLMMELTDIKEIMTFMEKEGEPDLSRYSGDKLKFCQDLIDYFRCMLDILYAGETAGEAQLQALRNKIRFQNPLYAGYSDTHIVSIRILKGDLCLAESFLDRLAETAVPRPDQLMKKKVYHAHARALIAKRRGRLRKAEDIIQQVMNYFNQQGCDDIPMAFLLHRHMGNIYYQQNRLDKARQCAADAEKNNSEHFGLYDEIMAGNELWLQLHLAAEAIEPALQCIRKIETLGVKLRMPRIGASAEVCTARMAISQGNLKAAGIWSKRRNVQPEEPFSMLYAMECLTQARLFYACEQFEETVHLLEILRNRCIERDLAELLLQINILQSAALHALNRPETAVRLLTEALAFSGIEGYIRPFVDDSKLIAPVLQLIAEKVPSDLSLAHLETILTACDIPIFKPAKLRRFSINDYEALTQRETEILEWISLGFQNKEIAQKAFIAITTVKSHVSNILVKLNVKTRTQAVLKAREIHILNAV